MGVTLDATKVGVWFWGNDGQVVGVRHDPRRCPLAAYCRESLGVEQLIDGVTAKELGPWVLSFIRGVDYSKGSAPITGDQAYDILQQVLGMK